MAGADRGGARGHAQGGSMPAPLATQVQDSAIAVAAEAPAAGSALAADRGDISDRLLAIAAHWWPLALIAAVAIAARWRYITRYHDSYGSGDAHLMLTRALFISRWDLEPSASAGTASAIFSNPPLIPFILAGFAKATTLPLSDAPVIVGPLIAIAGLFALYGVLCRAFDHVFAGGGRSVAVIATVLVALLPRFAFDSTEPDKVIYVVSFFAIALFFLYEGQQRPKLFLLAGLFMGLALFSYTTALVFVPVFLLSHVALSRGDLGKTFDRWFIAACAMPLLFFAAYLALDATFAPTPAALTGEGARPPAAAPAPPVDAPAAPVDAPSPLAPSDDGGLLPDQFDRYWENIKGLAGDGFQGSAWDLYLDAIRAQILDPVFFAAIAGFVLASWYIAAKRRFEMAPIVLWMAVVTVGFAIQLPAPSHSTRYPSYVTPAFVVLAVFALVWAARQVAARLELQPAYALAISAPFLAWVAWSYASAPEQGIRPLYAQHITAADYITSENLLADDAKLLYLGWPSYTYGLLEGGADPEHLQTFGWQRVNLANYRFADGLQYYLYDDVNEDYFNSGAQMLKQIDTRFTKEQVASFCTAPSQSPEGEICAGHVTLFRLTPR